MTGQGRGAVAHDPPACPRNGPTPTTSPGRSPSRGGGHSVHLM
jgi:hypothetical protein